MPSNIIKINDFSHFDQVQQDLLTLLAQMNIGHETYRHPPIFTVEEGETLNLSAHIPGQGGKSLLLTNKNDELWLVIACENTRVNLKSLSDRLETKRFSFAKPETMVDVMGVTPGSATPFALMNDNNRKLRVVLDGKFLTHEYCVFHPLRNDHSTVIETEALLRFIKALGYDARIMELA